MTPQKKRAARQAPDGSQDEAGTVEDISGLSQGHAGEASFFVADGIADIIPLQMRQLPAWLIWQAVPKKDRPGKFDKVPYYASSNQRRLGTQGTPEDRAQLVTMDAALAAMRRHRRSGIGIAMLEGHGLAGVDVDDAKDAAGEWKVVARAILESGTYAEESPSGKGLRLFFLGHLDTASNADVEDGVGVETYSRTQFLTVTGRRINGHDQLLPLTDEWRGQFARLVEKKSTTEVEENTTPRIKEGGRDNAITKIGGALRRLRYRFDAGELAGMLAVVNESRCDPPMPESDIRRIAHSVARYESKVATFADGPPIDLFKRFGVPSFVGDEVPAVISEYAMLQARRDGYDPTIYITAGVAIAAGMIDDRIVVDLGGDHTQSARLWMVVIGHPGAGKTPAQKKMAAPMLALQRQWLRDYDKRVAQQKQAEEEARKDRPKGEKGEPPERVPRPVLFTSNATPEATVDLLRDNPRGITFLVDEIESWVGSMGQYSKKGGSSPGRADLIALNDGGERNIDRVLRGNMAVPNWGASLLAATTPAAMVRMGDEVRSDDGLLQRMLLVETRPSQDEDLTISDAQLEVVRHRYASKMKALAEGGDALIKKSAREEFRVGLSEEAAALWRSEKRRLRLKMELIRGHNPPLAGYFAKSAGMLARVALIFHVIDAISDPEYSDLSATTMRMAMRFMGKIEAHSQTIYTELYHGNDGARDLPRKIAYSILASGLSEFNATELTEACKAFRARPEREQQAALKVLADFNWIAPMDPQQDPRGYGARWVVNSAVHELYAAEAERQRELRAQVAATIKSTAGGQ